MKIIKNLIYFLFSSLNTVEIDKEEVRADCFDTTGPHMIRTIADHYAIFKDLFGPYAYFIPRVKLEVSFSILQEKSSPVYFGNKIEPRTTENAPEVSFNHEFSLSHDGPVEKDSLWTLVLTNPDGNLENNEREYVHWMM